MFKFKLNQDAYTKLDETTQAFYKKDGDDYVLQVEGATSKDKLDEFRASNVELLKKAKQFDTIDMDKYNSMLETDRKLRDKELIAAGDIDTLVNEKVAAMQSDFDAKLLTATNHTNDATGKYNSLVTKHEIEGAALKAFGNHNIRPDAHNAVLAQIKSTFSIDNGSVVAKQGDKILTGSDGNLTIDEFVGQQPDFMRVPNTPGAGNGGQGGEGGGDNGTALSKISAGLKALG